MPLIKNINDFNERIEFLEGGYEQMPDGTWEEVANKVAYSCWCMVKTRTLSDYKTEYGTILQDTIKFVIRSKQEYLIKQNAKVRWQSKLFEVIERNPDTAKKEFDVLICKSLENNE